MPNILISGAARRIGKSLAIRFAQNSYNIALHYHKSVQEAESLRSEIKNFGVECVLIQADVRNRAEVEKSFSQASEFLGSIDVLVNNAGVFPQKTQFGEITDELWDDTFDINLKGALYFSQAFAKVAAQGSRIINIASVGGLEVWKGRSPYNVSKAAIIQLSKSMAIELAPNISVNCVCPGTIAFENDNKNLLVAESRIPMGRYGTADDIFDAVKFFAESSGYITGQVLLVDGGYHLAR